MARQAVAFGPEPPPDRKRCGRCGSWLATTEFYVLHGQRRRRLQSYCRSCCRQAQREWSRTSRGLPADAVLKPGREAAVGDRTTHRGYVLIKVGAGRDAHPRASQHGWVYEHIVVAEQKYDMAIGREWTVHHRNRNRADNRPENLELRLGNHGKGGDAIPTLLHDRDLREQAAAVLRAYGYVVEAPA